jgi:hypothetical protein
MMAMTLGELKVDVAAE